MFAHVHEKMVRDWCVNWSAIQLEKRKVEGMSIKHGHPFLYPLEQMGIIGYNRDKSMREKEGKQ